MWRNKKMLIISVLAAVLLFGVIGGVALAQTADEEDIQTQTPQETLLDRVLEIYEQNTGVAIDREALKDAFVQARDERQIEALQNRLDYLVEQGKITQDEADQYLEWWQAKPDVQAGYGLRAGRIGRMGGGCRFGGIELPGQTN